MALTQKHIQDTCTRTRIRTIAYTYTHAVDDEDDDAQCVAETCGVVKVERLVGIFPRRVVPKYIAHIYICIKYMYVCIVHTRAVCIYVLVNFTSSCLPERRSTEGFFYMPSFCLCRKAESGDYTIWDCCKNFHPHWTLNGFISKRFCIVLPPLMYNMLVFGFLFCCK